MRLTSQTGSIRGRLLIVALVPLLAILPLGIRSAVQDLSTWNQARDSVGEAALFSEGASITQAVRAEWLAALDVTAFSSNDFVSDSAMVGDRAMAVAEETERAFAQAIAETDALLEGFSQPSTALEGRTTLLARIEAERVIPAEIDLFYSRALTQWESETGDGRFASGRDDPDVRAAEATLDVIGDVDTSVAELRHELTLVADRFFVSAGVDWPSLADQVDETRRAVQRVDRLSLGATEGWGAFRSPLLASLGTLDGLIEQAPGPGDTSVIDEVETVIAVRDDLTGTAEDLSVQRQLVIDTAVDATENVQRDAGWALALSSALFLIAILVTAFVATRVHRWISEPLRDAADRARALSSGNLSEVSRDTVEGPREVRALSAAFDRVTDTVTALEEQARAINSGRLDDPALERKLPGNLGKSLEGTIGRWRETTMRLEHEVSHDPITDLASLRAMERHAETLLQDGPITVAYLALDHFKGVNDAAGRTTGDEVLKRVAKRIERRAANTAMTARLWGDEFAILLPASAKDDMRKSVDKALEAVSEPVTVDGNSWRLSATIGVAEGTQFDRVINDASIATRHGKRCGGAQIVYHDEAFAALRDKRARIEAELLVAMAEDELELWFQPAFDMSTDEASGAEALIRWRLSDGSLRLPGDFIPIAEESDLIVELDRWTINAVCKQLVEWRGTPMENLRIAINVSGRHILRDDLASVISDACLRHGLNPSLLGVEVTESYLVNDVPAVQRTLEELQSLGVELLLDDFGTGYSSLAYLRDLPFDTLKIDRAFVERLDNDEPAKKLVGAIIALADELGMSTVAEGIETDEQHRVLAKLGCKVGQGFGLARPMPPGDQLLAAVGHHEQSLGEAA